MPTKEHKASDYLHTPEDIAAYLNAAMEEMGDDPRLLMMAFRNVAEAQGGVSAVARQANVDRVSLSRALSGKRTQDWTRSRRCLPPAVSNCDFQHKRKNT